MGIIEEIKRMQIEGRTEQEIVSSLQGKGYSPEEVHDALAQAKIKEAVLAPTPEENYAEQMPAKSPLQTEMQPSMLTSSTAQESLPLPPPEQPSQLPTTTYPGYQTYSSAPYQDYYSYAPTSAETISEIAEQIVAEKIQELKSDLDKILSFKNTVETKIEYLDERLKRIEKIIDRLQLSILQKVGEHILNVEDLKKEIIETQKTIKAVLPQTQTKT